MPPAWARFIVELGIKEDDKKRTLAGLDLDTGRLT
jgi:hypothetical protein